MIHAYFIIITVKFKNVQVLIRTLSEMERSYER